MRYEWKFSKGWEWGGVACLGVEDAGSELSEGRKMETYLELVRSLSGPQRGKCEGAGGETQAVPRWWRLPVPGSGSGLAS